MAIAGIATITRSTRVNLDCRFKSWYHCLIVRKVHPPFLSSHFLSVLRGGKSGILLEALSEVIAMSANAFAEDIINSRISGMDEHLTKPLEPARLVNVLKDCIWRRKHKL